MDSPATLPWLTTVVSNDGSKVAMQFSGPIASLPEIVRTGLTPERFRLSWDGIEAAPHSVQAVGVWLILDLGDNRIASGSQVSLAWLETAGGETRIDQSVVNSSTVGAVHRHPLTGTGELDFLQGSIGIDYLSAGEGDDLLDAGPGDDTLVAGGGTNHFLWGRGDGRDTLGADYSSGTTPTGLLWIKAGITPDQLKGRIARDNPSDVELFVEGSDEVLRVSSFLAGPLMSGVWALTPNNRVNPLSEVMFADGTRWTRYDLLRLVLNGSDDPDYLQGTIESDVLRGGLGNDTLIGLDGDDTLIGGPGQDRLDGGAGSNVYRVDIGDGVDTITPYYQAGPRGHGILEFGKGISPSSVVAKVSTENPSDVELWIGGTADRIVIGGLLGGQGPTGQWVASSDNVNNPVQVLRFADGTLWTAAALEAIVRERNSTQTSPTPAPGGSLSNAEQPAASTVTNRAPLAGDGTLKVAGPGPHAATLPWATDPEGDALRYEVATLPEHGTVAVMPDGLFRYTTAVGFAGKDLFRFAVVDERGASSIYAMHITVTAAPTATIEIVIPTNSQSPEPQTVVNRAPVGRDGASDLLEDAVLQGRLASATDPDGDPTTYALSSLPRSGSATVESNGSFVYRPAPNYSGIDSFRYSISDSKGGVNSYTQTFYIRPVNDSPRLASPLEDALAHAGEPLFVNFPRDLFSDADTPDLTWSVTTPLGSSLPEWLRFDAGTRTLTGTPGVLQVGTTTVVVRVSDGHSTASALLNLVVSPGTQVAPPTPEVTDVSSNKADGRAAELVVVSGSEGDDLLVGGPGDDQFDGGPGIDRLQFLHPRDAYQWSRAFDGSFTVQGPEGTDKISGVERLLFGESILALDLAESQSTGQAALLLGAVLGKNLLLQKSELTRVVVELFDSGYSLEVLAGAIMRLPIWGGVLTPSDAPSDIATYLLTTVLGKLPSAEEISDAVWQMGSGPQGAFLASLALSQSNQGQVDLIGLQQTGLWLGASSSA